MEDQGGNRDQNRDTRLEIIGGIVFGTVLGMVLFIVPESIFNDSIRIMLTVVIGLIVLGILRQRLQRPMKRFTLWMVGTFVLFIAVSAVILLIRKLGI